MMPATTENKMPKRVADRKGISTKKATIKFDIAEGAIDAGLAVGRIQGPGEFEIGDITIRAIATTSGRTIYDADVHGVRVGILGPIEENLDDICSRYPRN